jgi:hypothetical protein
MPFIPRQVKPPARLPLTCKVPEETATLLKLYAEFLDSTQEYVVVETLRLAFRKDKEFHGWLATTHPGTRLTDSESLMRPADPPRHTHEITTARANTSALTDPRAERSRP